MAVELAHVASPLLGRGQLRCQRVGFATLAHEVVRCHARLARGLGGDARRLVPRPEQRQHAVEQHLALDEALEAQPEVLDHAPAEVSAGGGAALVPKHVVEQRVHVAGVRREVVEAIGREVRVAESAQVRCDHLEAGLGQRSDVAPPDALGLRPAVHEQQRIAARARAYVGDAQPLTDARVLDRKRVGGGRRG